MAERSLWEMFLSLFQRAKEKRNERKEQRLLRVRLEQEKFRHLFRVPAGQNYQALIDQIMNHEPYDTPILQKGRLVNARRPQKEWDAQYFNTPSDVPTDHRRGADGDPPADGTPA